MNFYKGKYFNFDDPKAMVEKNIMLNHAQISDVAEAATVFEGNTIKAYWVSMFNGCRYLMRENPLEVKNAI